MTDDQRQVTTDMAERLQDELTAAWAEAKEQAETAEAIADHADDLARAARTLSGTMRTLLARMKDLAAAMREDGEPR
jgi:hypothetical protein